MNINLENKLKAYYVTAILGVVFAVAGFGYNTWRLELSEDNNNVRTASFEVLTKLAELEQVIYAAHYDKDVVLGSPRKGWVMVGLIADLSSLISKPVEIQSLELKKVWSENWENMADDQAATEQLVEQIERVRKGIKTALTTLS
ncbi:hypothetical protein MNBD_GAMMA15-740 [hydrothermal vent metagenome]|uniref:CHASE3 domain-containing protein n=1 Tax=hydrothermal vent metagenome TaxID=652676 RepID=A0A3B0YB68_9ZZZZ